MKHIGSFIALNRFGLGVGPGEADDAEADSGRRDIRPTTACESLFKATLIDRLGVSPAAVEDDVFPDSRDLTTAGNLFRTA